MSSVTFLTTVGGDGSTVTDDSNPSTGLANGGHRTRFVPALAQTVAVAANTVEKATEAAASATSAAASAASAAAIAGAFVSTSSTTWTPTIGSKIFTVQTGEQYTAGIFVTVVSASAPSVWGFGQVTSYSGDQLTVDVQVISGSTSKTDWNISLTGARGAPGLGITPQAVGFLLSGGTSVKTMTVDVDLTASNVTQLTATQTLTNKTLTGLKETKTAPTISSGALTLDCSTGNVFAVALNANVTTLTFSNVPTTTGTAYALSLALTANGTAYTVTWPASVKWPAGTAPTLTSTNGKVDTLVLATYDGGTTWYAFVAGQNA